MTVYVVSAFEERRERILDQLERRGKIAPADITIVEAPRGVEAAALGWSACRRWRDPQRKRLLTWGEMACQAGHAEAWRRIVESGDGYVVEDDADILAPLASATVRGDLTRLAWVDLEDPNPVEDGLRRAVHHYWDTAYWITREAAARLLDALRPGAVIPSDEFVTYHGGRNPNVKARHEQAPCLGLETWTLPQPIAAPSGKWASGTENGPSAFALETFVFATEPKRAQAAVEAYGQLGYTPVILGAGQPHWDTSGPGCGAKLRLLQDALEAQEGQDNLQHRVILAVDGYDTLPVRDADEALLRFAELDADIVLAGERTCWPPDKERQRRLDEFHAASKHPEAPFRYPNSGVICGFRQDVLAALQGSPHSEQSDDQQWWQERLPASSPPWRVDSEGYLSLCLNHAGAGRRKGWPYSPATRCYPAILHGNGGANMQLAAPTAYRQPLLAEGAFEWIELADGILGMPFLDPDARRWIAAEAERLDSLWKPLPGDNVPGDELRLNVLDLALRDWLEKTLSERLPPIVEQRWKPARWPLSKTGGVKDAFLIRYSAEGQASIRLHEDRSYFSCSVRLRTACAGGELYFPRQNFNDALVPSGWLLLWPSRITHPHQVLPVSKGRRVSLVVWTKE